MPLPVILAPAGAAAVGTAISGATEKVGQGLAGLFGDTAKDKARRARAQQLEAAALAGDAVALRQLAFDAFEPANGLPGDNRPVDFGTRSPPLTRDLSRAALKRYADKYGGLPSDLAQYAAQLNVPVSTTTPLLRQVLQPAVDTITDAALERAAQRTQEKAREYTPLLLGGAALVAVLIYAMVRRK